MIYVMHRCFKGVFFFFQSSNVIISQGKSDLVAQHFFSGEPNSVFKLSIIIIFKRVQSFKFTSRGLFYICASGMIIKMHSLLRAFVVLFMGSFWLSHVCFFSSHLSIVLMFLKF